MIGISAWRDENKNVVLSEQERDFLTQTRDLEFHASRIYRAAAKDSEKDEIKGFFKYLARTEKEHYEVACKLLGEPISDDINGLGDDSKGNDHENLLESKRLEEHATKLYADFSVQSSSPRIKDFFAALAGVESNHIQLDNVELAKE
jgi:rubrerythrin